MSARQRLNGPPLMRAVQAEAKVSDEESRRVRLSFSSEVEYLRVSWFDEPWVEVLGHGEGEADLSRVASGNAPLLWGHDSYSRSSNVGVVEKAWIENGRGYADVRFSGRDDVRSLFEDVRDGIVTNVSVGYQINERTLVKQNKEGPSEYRVTRWTPMEISLVSVPADTSVGVGRSADTTRSYTWTDLEESAMSEQNTTPAAPVIEQRQEGSAAPDVSALVRDATATAVRAERERVDAINNLARNHNLGDDFARTHIANGAAAAAASDAALAILAERNIASHPSMKAGTDESEKQAAAAESWLLKRAGEKVDAAALNGNDFRGMSMLDVAKSTLARNGVSTRGLNSMEVAGLALRFSPGQGTSHFPVLLQNVMHKVLLNAYVAQADTWSRWCAIGSVSDFRAHYRYRMGSFGNLSAVTEQNEFQHGTLSDAERESITAATKGKLFAVSRQLLINDDLGGLANIMRDMGRGAKRTVESDVYALLTSASGAGPTMGDTGALFNATAITTAGGHANLLASGTAPTVAAFDAVRQAMAIQKDPALNDFLGIRPAIWLGPVALGGAARVVNDAQYDVDVSNKFQYPNKSRGLVRDVIDTPYLTGAPWYMLADPSEHPTFEVAFLNGQQEPFIEVQNGFEVDGITYKVRLDYAVGAVGWRGAYRNAGA